MTLSPWVQIGLMVAALTVVIGIAGLSLRDSGEPALKRLAAVLLGLGPRRHCMGVVVVQVPSLFDRAEEGAFVPVDVVDRSRGQPPGLYRAFPHFFTHLSMFVLVGFVCHFCAKLIQRPGFTTWCGSDSSALGLAWILLTEAGVLVPDRLGLVLGTGAALIGAGASSEYGWDPWFPGLFVAALIVAFGVVRGQPLLVGLGAAGFFIFLAMLLFEELNESAALLVLLVIGVGLVIGVWAWARRNRSAPAGG